MSSETSQVFVDRCSIASDAYKPTKRIWLLIAIASAALASCASPALKKTQPDWTHDFGAVHVPARASEFDRREGPRVVISISGGGTRSANIGLGMMLALDSIPAGLEPSPANTLLRQVRYASTVSGGGLPVAAYLSLMFAGKNGPCRAQPPMNLFEALMRDRANADSKIILLRKPWIGAFFEKTTNIASWNTDAANSDLFVSSYFVPLTSARCDDGRSQELSLSDAIDNEYLTHIPNATVSLNGDVFPFTEAHLKHINLQGVLAKTGSSYTWSSNLTEPFAKNVPYATAIAASAAFPPLLADLRLAVKGGDNKPSFVHLTDGGQADDDGATSSLNALETLQAQPAQDARVLYLALDALPDQGGYVSASQDPADLLNVLFERNMDLPRYGPKRDLASQVYSDVLQQRSTRLDDIGRLYVAHIGAWRYKDQERSDTSKDNDEKLVKVSTLEAGRKGLTTDQQSAMIAAGIVLTYDALFGDAVTKAKRKTIKDEARKIALCVVRPISSYLCLDSAAAWSDLVRSGADLSISGQLAPGFSERGLVEFARKQKMNDWGDLVKASNNNLSAARDKLAGYADAATRQTLAREQDVLETLERTQADATAANQTLNDFLFKNFTESFEAELKTIDDAQEGLESKILRTREENKDRRDLLSALKRDKVDLSECSCGQPFTCAKEGFDQIGLVATDDPVCRRPEVPSKVETEDASVFSAAKRATVETLQDTWRAVFTSRRVSDNLLARLASSRKELCEHKKWLDDLAQQQNVLVSAKVHEAFLKQMEDAVVCPPEEDKVPTIPDSTVNLELKNVEAAVKLLMQDSQASNQCLIEKRALIGKQFDNIVSGIESARRKDDKLIETLQDSTLRCSVVLQRALGGDPDERTQIGACITTLRRGLAVTFTQEMHTPVATLTADICGKPMTLTELQAKVEKKDGMVAMRPSRLSAADEALLHPYREAIVSLGDFAQAVDAGTSAFEVQDADEKATKCFSERRRITYGNVLVPKNSDFEDCSKLMYKTSMKIIVTN